MNEYVSKLSITEEEIEGPFATNSQVSYIKLPFF